MSADILKTPLDVCSAPIGPPPLQHQSKSYPGGQPLQLCRTPSVSSQSSLESTASKQVKYFSVKIMTHIILWVTTAIP